MTPTLARARSLALGLYRRHAPAYRARCVDRDDLVGEAWLAVVRCGRRDADYALVAAWHAATRPLRRPAARPLEGDPIDPESAPAVGFDDLVAPLEPAARELLALAYRDGLTVREIAARVSQPPATVARRLAHARERVRLTVA